MNELKNAISKSLGSMAKGWKRAKRSEDKHGRIPSAHLYRMRYHSDRLTIREVAFRVMEEAYMKASGGGKYPANARQIYYAARPAILKECTAADLSSQYFTQTLLKDYMDRWNPSWDIVFDARGRIAEPHTGEVVGLGGVEVRQHIAKFTDGNFAETPPIEVEQQVPTVGPSLRYGAVLFIEKEGFNELLEAAKIALRFDVAIASTKGMPVSALCDLLAKLKQAEIKAYVVHDFDKSGFSIVSTLRKGTRGSQGTGEIVDLGFRLEDIEGLEREPVSYNSSPEWNLRKNGATAEEIEILAPSWNRGERVELNAMTSDEFIEWLEAKFEEHGIEKVVPDEEKLKSAYRRAVFLQAIKKKIKEESDRIRNEIADVPITAPADLADLTRAVLDTTPELSWDQAVWDLANGGDDPDEEDDPEEQVPDEPEQPKRPKNRDKRPSKGKWPGAELGLTKEEAKRAMRLSEVPEKEFEAAMAAMKNSPTAELKKTIREMDDFFDMVDIFDLVDGFGPAREIGRKPK